MFSMLDLIRQNVSQKSLIWFGLALSLLLITLGPVGFLCAILSVLCFFAGIIAIIYQHGREEVELMKHRFSNNNHIQISTGIVDINENFEKPQTDEESLTGSPIIDERLQECIKFLIRDYVKYWYYELSDNQDFINSLHSTLAEVIRTIAIRCKTVDWQTYLTTKFVDDFASHVRLFRKSQEGFALLKEQDSSEQDNTSLSSASSNSSQTKQQSEKDTAERIIGLFFDIEIDVEKTCRELVSCDPEKQKEYLQATSEVLLYLVLPQPDFHSRPLKCLLREILVHGIMQPVLKLFSDPDYVNQYISWMISDNCLISEAFLTVMRHSKNTGELEAIEEKTKEEITKICAKDAVGDDPVIKQQLSSMQYVRGMCAHILAKQASLEEANDLDSIGIGKPGALYNLPLDVTLRNNIALQFFIEYMQAIDQQAYLFFWLTVEGYRVSAEQQLNALKIQQLSGEMRGTPDIEMLRVIGRNIYEQYLSKTSSSFVELDSASDKEILRKLTNEEPSPNVFDDLQKAVFSKMQRDDNLYPSFKRSELYVKLLAELDLLREPSIQSEDTYSMEDDGSVDDSDENSRLYATITTTCVCTEHGKSYAMFAISAVREQVDSTGKVIKQDTWDTFRRYSDFAHLHDSLKETNCNMSTLKLPGKSIFKSVSEDFIQKRRTDLNAYLQAVLALERTPAITEAIHTFLDAKAYKRNSKTLAKRVDLMRSSVRNATDSFRDSIFRASDKVSDGLQKISQRRITLSANGMMSYRQNEGEFYDNCRVSEQIDNIEDNIPLRILLLLMDEVFDLKQRNQWLRRQVVAALQQFVRALFGDRMNRKIVDYVDNAVSADQVAEYIRKFSESFWPSGILAETATERDYNCKMRTRVLTKSKLLGAIPDELRPLVGTETSRRGIMRVFQMFQHPELNTRLLILLLEGVLQLLFPSNNFNTVFNKLNSESPKMQARLREDKRRKNTKKQKV